MTFGRLVLGLLLLWAAGTDIAWRRIPNPLICVGLAVFTIEAAWLWCVGEIDFLTGCVLAGIIAFVLHLIPYLLRSMGAGDVKLALITGLLLGWEAWLDYLGLFCAASLLVSGCVLLTGKHGRRTLPLAPVMASAYILYCICVL